MSLKTPVEYHTSLAPTAFFEQLSEATVLFEDILSLEKPLEGYANYLKESFTGEKTVAALIKGDEARLMPIGFWPVKGRSALANSGYLSCKVRAAETGSIIRASYQLAWIYKIAIPMFLIFAFFMVIAIAALILYGEGLDGRWGLVGAAGFAIFLCVGFSIYYLRGARTQSKLTREFLAEFVAKTASA